MKKSLTFGHLKKFSFRTLFLISLLVLNVISISAQGKKNLDFNFGLKKFKLETSYSLHKSHLKYYDTDKQGVEYYTYTNTDVNDLFGIAVKEVMLGYYNEKLYIISFSFGVIEKKSNLLLVQRLKDLYDIPEIIQPNPNNPNLGRVWIAQWETGKTYMLAGEYSCSSQIKSCETDLFMFSKNIKRQLTSK